MCIQLAVAKDHGGELSEDLHYHHLMMLILQLSNITIITLATPQFTLLR